VNLNKKLFYCCQIDNKVDFFVFYNILDMSIINMVYDS